MVGLILRRPFGKSPQSYSQSLSLAHSSDAHMVAKASFLSQKRVWEEKSPLLKPMLVEEVFVEAVALLEVQSFYGWASLGAGVCKKDLFLSVLEVNQWVFAEGNRAWW